MALIHKITLVAAFTLFGLLSALTFTQLPLYAHGTTDAPVSRVYQCYLENPESPDSAACAAAIQLAGTQQFYDWSAVNRFDANDRHREIIPDGQLCSGGKESHRGLDLPRADWQPQTITPDAFDNYEFSFIAWAPHATKYFDFYVTKDGYDPMQPLKWSDLEATPFCHITSVTLADGHYKMSCPLPQNKTGNHLIYNIWQRSDSQEAFYTCMDVAFSYDGTPLPSPTPSSTSTPDPTACAVEYKITSDWGTGFNADVTLTNRSSKAWNGWRVTWAYGANQEISSLWNGVYAQSGSQIEVTHAAWNQAVQAGGSVTFGFQATYTGTNPAPLHFLCNNAISSPPTTTPVTTATPTATSATPATATPSSITTTPAAPTSTAAATSPACATAVPTATSTSIATNPSQPTMTPTSTATSIAQATATATSTGQAASPKRVIGYYTAWSIYDRKYFVTEIPADKLTHINYAFANVSPVNGSTGGECVLGDSYADTEYGYPGDSQSDALRGNFNQLNKLKKQHPQLKTLLSVGGWTWSSNFSAAALTTASRQRFAQSCVQMMGQYGFDGLDIDWEYPVSGGLTPGQTEDKQNYTLLLAELRTQLNTKASQDGRAYLLTIAAPAGPTTLANLELNKIAQYLDWINLMTYDFHGSWDNRTGFNAALYADPSDPFNQGNLLTVNAATQSYLAAGIPADKLVIGVPFYGRGWKGVSNTNNGLYQLASGVPQGTWEAGMFDYHDLKQNYLPTYTRSWNFAARVPWLYNPDTGIMISYDDPESLALKVDYVKNKGLGGVMIWELSGDDAQSSLLRILNGGVVQTDRSTSAQVPSAGPPCSGQVYLPVVNR